ncbi:unnamed protein product, partial [Linum tenue]
PVAAANVFRCAARPRASSRRLLPPTGSSSNRSRMRATSSLIPSSQSVGEIWQSKQRNRIPSSVFSALLPSTAAMPSVLLPQWRRSETSLLSPSSTATGGASEVETDLLSPSLTAAGGAATEVETGRRRVKEKLAIRD